MYNRGREHKKQYNNKEEKSVMWKHVVNEHKDEEDQVEFEMKLDGAFKTPLQRITNEGIRIKNTKPECLLNSKNEYYGPSVKRKTIL